MSMLEAFALSEAGVLCGAKLQLLSPEHLMTMAE